MVNERSIDGAKKRKWRKQKISTHLLLGETIGRLVMSQKVSQRRPEQVTEGKWVPTVASRPRQLWIYVQSFDAEGTFSTRST